MTLNMEKGDSKPRNLDSSRNQIRIGNKLTSISSIRNTTLIEH